MSVDLEERTRYMFDDNQLKIVEYIENELGVEFDFRVENEGEFRLGKYIHYSMDHLYIFEKYYIIEGDFIKIKLKPPVHTGYYLFRNDEKYIIVKGVDRNEMRDQKLNELGI